jgi:hypothetical protein
MSGFWSRAKLAEDLKDEDPARALLVWIRTAVDTFEIDSGGPQNAMEGWEVFARWIAAHRESNTVDSSTPAEQLLQRIADAAATAIARYNRERPIDDLRVVEPWIDDYLNKEPS